MTEQTIKNLKLARTARTENNSNDAKRFYDLVRIEEPDNCEAKFFYAYYNLMSGKVIEISSNLDVLINVTSAIPKVLSSSSEENKETLLREIYLTLCPLPQFVVNALSGIPNSHAGIVSFNAAKCIVTYADAVAIYFPELEQTLSLEAWKFAVSRCYNRYGKEEIVPYCLQKIKKHEPDYEAPKDETPQGVGCIPRKK